MLEMRRRCLFCESLPTKRPQVACPNGCGSWREALWPEERPARVRQSGSVSRRRDHSVRRRKIATGAITPA